MFTTEKYMEITDAYYSKWLGQDGILNRDWKGVEYVYSEQRNTVQYGYNTQFDLYALCQKDRIVISYGDKTGNRLNIVKNEINHVMPAEEVSGILEKIFRCGTYESIKYRFESMRDIPSNAKVLAAEDYSEYKNFFRKCNPGCRDTGWLKDYFEEMVQAHLCIGVYADGGLVSCTDAPGMPFMAQQAQEIGINTLKEYRGKGYASMACSRCIHEMTACHKVPLWSAAADNQASRRLAKKVGFIEYAEVISATL